MELLIIYLFKFIFQIGMSGLVHDGFLQETKLIPDIKLECNLVATSLEIESPWRVEALNPESIYVHDKRQNILCIISSDGLLKKRISNYKYLNSFSVNSKGEVLLEDAQARSNILIDAQGNELHSFKFVKPLLTDFSLHANREIYSSPFYIHSIPESYKDARIIKYSPLGKMIDNWSFREIAEEFPGLLLCWFFPPIIYEDGVTLISVHLPLIVNLDFESNELSAHLINDHRLASILDMKQRDLIAQKGPEGVTWIFSDAKSVNNDVLIMLESPAYDEPFKMLRVTREGKVIKKYVSDFGKEKANLGLIHKFAVIDSDPALKIVVFGYKGQKVNNPMILARELK